MSRGSVAARVVAAIGLLIVCGAIAFVSGEAGKEVIHLCGNFTGARPGTVTETSVSRQLATASWSTWRVEATPAGRRHRLDSRLGPARLCCEVAMDPEGRLLGARLWRTAAGRGSPDADRRTRTAGQSRHATDEARTDPR